MGLFDGRGARCDLGCAEEARTPLARRHHRQGDARALCEAEHYFGQSSESKVFQKDQGGKVRGGVIVKKVQGERLPKVFPLGKKPTARQGDLGEIGRLSHCTFLLVCNTPRLCRWDARKSASAAADSSSKKTPVVPRAEYTVGLPRGKDTRCVLLLRVPCFTSSRYNYIHARIIYSAF